LCRKGYENKSPFSTNITVHLGNDTRYDHSYNGILTETYAVLSCVNSNDLDFFIDFE